MEGAVALYLRLSQEDMDIRKGAARDESDSIRSQRMMLRTFLKGHSDLVGRPVLEFVDDGYTGTNFERPQFQKMMELVRTGDIYCILVKDLSRFGRNYLEVGDYLEHLFPFLGVRFIAVNDHYDSDNFIGSTGGLDVAFRNLIYQRYSQDLSEKVKAGKHIRMARGKHITGCPYGYKKKPGVKDQMIIDPETAPVVKEIFRSIINGMKTTEVAAALNERRVITPAEYKKISRDRFTSEPMWSHQAILRIVKDYKYTGAMVNFKCESRTIRAKTSYRKPPEEWVITENCHEPIVSHEEYELANSKIRKKSPFERKHSDGKDWVYYCGHCGRRLRKTHGLDEYYSCATQLYRKGAICTSIFWSRTDIEQVVLSAYKAQLQLMNEKYQQRQKEMQEDPLIECRKRQAAISAKLAQFDNQNFQLYEQYREGKFGKEDFLQKKGKLISDKKELEQKLQEEQQREEGLLQKQKERQAQEVYLAESEDLLQATDEELRERMYDDIEKVTVYSSEEIEITWKWGDIFTGSH